VKRTGLNQQDERTATRLASHVRSRFGERLVQVVLYGSKARGDSTVESDTDLLLLFKDRPAHDELREVTSFRTELDIEHGTVTTLLVESVDEWRSPVNKATQFYRNVSEQGIEL